MQALSFVCSSSLVRIILEGFLGCGIFCLFIKAWRIPLVLCYRMEIVFLSFVFGLFRELKMEGARCS